MDNTDAPPSLKQTVVLACGPTGFQGASQIMCSWLRALSSHGATVIYFGSRVPFSFEHFGSGGVEFREIKEISTGAMGEGSAVASRDILLIPRLAEEIAREARSRSHEAARIIIWGTYLFPYGVAASLAFTYSSSAARRTEVWLTPTGSDIWEIGPQVPNATKCLLENDAVRRVILYTKRFEREVRAMCQHHPRFENIYPSLDSRRFSYVDPAERIRRKVALGVSTDAFILSSHSNMRPVKRPSDVVAIAQSFAVEWKRPVHLFLIGPHVDISTMSSPSNLAISAVGIVANVQDYLQISDAEVNCSLHDSFNLSLAEAMACGTPCASTDVVGISDEILRCGVGCLYHVEEQIGPSHSAVKFLLSLAKDPQGTEVLRRRAASHMGECCSEQAIGRQLLRLLR